jgi:uncharacterized coiled-coil protein SlyX
METKPVLYIMTVIIIATILTSAYVSSIKINELEGTINTQSDQLDSYNGLLNSQADQLESLNQRMDEQDNILDQYNQTITQQNQTITQQNSEIEKYQQITLVDDAGYIVNITSCPERICFFSAQQH